MITVSFDVVLLKAAALSVAKKDVGTPFNGVYVDLVDCNLQSTNGYLAFISRPNSITATPAGEVNGFIIPNSMIEQILKIKYGKSTEQRVLTITYNNYHLTATLGNASLTGAATKNRFPNVKGVYNLDNTPDKLALAYSYCYLKVVSDTQKALMPLLPKEIDGITMEIGTNKAIFSVGDDLAHIIVMGMRGHNPFSFYQFKKQ